MHACIRYFQSVCTPLSEITTVELTSIARNGEEKTASTILARKHHRNDNLGRFKRTDENHFRHNTENVRYRDGRWMELTLTASSVVITTTDPASSPIKVNYCYLFKLIRTFTHFCTSFIHSASPYYLRHSI